MERHGLQPAGCEQHCLALKRICESRQDAHETQLADRRFDELSEAQLPPCVSERASFMAPYPLMRTVTHPYREAYPDTHSHFRPTRIHHLPYAATCVPFRWMLRESVEGNAKKNDIGLATRLQLGWILEREPQIKNRNGSVVTTSWVQEADNQAALLETFFGALRPQESLCFFYAKRTPLSKQSRRVIIGIGRVLAVGAGQEHNYAPDQSGELRSMIWERSIGHSIRPTFTDGFLFPYHEALELAEREGLDAEQFVAFAPDEQFAT